MFSSVEWHTRVCIEFCEGGGRFHADPWLSTFWPEIIRFRSWGDQGKRIPVCDMICFIFFVYFNLLITDESIRRDILICGANGMFFLDVCVIVVYCCIRPPIYPSVYLSNHPQMLPFSLHIYLFVAIHTTQCYGQSRRIFHIIPI